MNERLAWQAKPSSAVLLDAMGTLVRLEDPAPRLRAALRMRLGVDVGDDAARAAIRAEIACYRAHMHTGRDAAAVDALRARCAEAMRDALPAPAAAAPGPVLTAALLDAIRIVAFPDAAPALRTLKAAGHALVVVSNWDVSLGERLEEAGLAPLLDRVVCSAAVGAAKPAPAMFARALALAGVPAGAAWHVGDDLEADVTGAAAAGVRPVLLDRAGAATAPPGVPVLRTLDGLAALVGA